MANPIDSKEVRARQKLLLRNLEELEILLRWLTEDFVLLPPGWTDQAAFAALIREVTKVKKAEK